MERILPLSQLIELCEALETACDMTLETGHVVTQSTLNTSEPVATAAKSILAATGVKPATIPRNHLNALDSLSIVSWIQRRLNALGYNHLPGNPFFVINKRASARSLGHVAASMFAAGLPIKCLEAVVLSMWLISEVLPAGISSVPIAFKSVIHLPGSEPSEVAAGKQYRHIVLAVAHNANRGVSGEGGEVWGALGLSRRKDLMNKPFQYKSLADLIEEYLLAYENNGHKVNKVKIGLPAPKNMGVSTSPIVWKHMILRISPFPAPNTAASRSLPSTDALLAPMSGSLQSRAGQLSLSQRQTLATYWREVRPMGLASAFPSPQSPVRGGMLRSSS